MCSWLMPCALPQFVRIDRGVATELDHWLFGVALALRRAQTGRATYSIMTTIPLVQHFGRRRSALSAGEYYLSRDNLIDY